MNKAEPWKPPGIGPDAFLLSAVWHLSAFSFPRTAWVQKIKAASELYIETEKKKREKAYLGNGVLAAGPCRAGQEASPGPGALSPQSWQMGPGGEGPETGWKRGDVGEWGAGRGLEGKVQEQGRESFRRGGEKCS